MKQTSKIQNTTAALNRFVDCGECIRNDVSYAVLYFMLLTKVEK